MDTRFKGWTCLADKAPEVGNYLVGMAGSEDEKVWHAVPLYWTGAKWQRANGTEIPSSLMKPDRTFYKAIA